MPEKKKVGRPPTGPTVKTALPPAWIELLNSITTRLQERTGRPWSNAGIAVHLRGKDRAWDRSGVIAMLLQATARQFAQTVLGGKHVVKYGDLCPLCFGYVDGPHAGDCGYFGPLSEHDPQRGERLRNVLHRTGLPSSFGNVDGKVAEIYGLDASPPADLAT